MDKPKIYIVDDSDDYRFLIQQIFNKFLPQYLVQFFSGGEIVLKNLFLSAEQSGEEFPSLILMDLNMPVLNGYHTLKEIKNPADPVFSFIKRIPVIIMSNDETADEVNECYRAGANAFLRKPIEFEHLKDLLKSVCYFWLQVNQMPVMESR